MTDQPAEPTHGDDRQKAMDEYAASLLAKLEANMARVGANEPFAGMTPHQQFAVAHVVYEAVDHWCNEEDGLVSEFWEAYFDGPSDVLNRVLAIREAGA